MSTFNRPSVLLGPTRRGAQAVGAVALLLALAACKEQVADAPEPIRPVKAMVVTASAPERDLTLSGTVEARIAAGLGFRVPGKIVERLVGVGDRVEAGTVVARLDPVDLRLALQAADANVEGARARVQVATDALARSAALHERGHIAKAALDRAGLDLEQAQSALDAAVSSREQAANQTVYTELKADGPGIVTEVRAEPGQVVAAGAPVAVVARDGEKEVRVAVPEQDIRHFARGQEVRVSFWAAPDLIRTGRIREIAGSADPASRTFAVRVALPHDPGVRLGQTATVTAAVPIGSAAITIPLAALAKSGEDTVVWVVDRATETVKPRRVETGSLAPEGVRVAGGLAPGDMVVTAGTQFLIEGKKIRLVGSEVTARLER